MSEANDRKAVPAVPAPAPAGPGYRPTTEPIWLGVGSPQPQTRLIRNTLFGHVPDAFDEKSIKVGEVAPFERRRLEQVRRDEARLEAERAREEEATAAEGVREAARQEDRERKAAMEQERERVMRQERAALGLDEDDLVGCPGVLIRGGRVVNDDESFISDVYFVGKKIVRIGVDLTAPEGVTVIDATNCYVLPGGIDTSTYFGATRQGVLSVDDFYDGTRAAVGGGTTLIINSVCEGEGETPLAAYERVRGTADPSVCCDYALRVDLATWSDLTSQDMDTLANSKGVNSFSLLMGGLSDAHLYQAFRKCKELGALAQILPDNCDVIGQRSSELIAQGVTGPEGYLLSRPEEVETEAVNRAVMLAGQAGAPVYVGGVTGRGSAEVVACSRRKGKVVFGEAACAALVLDGSRYYDKSWLRAAAPVNNTPLRVNPSPAPCLISLLASGDLHAVASTHCTFSAEQKGRGRNDFRLIPPGVNGVTERMALVWHHTVGQGKMGPCEFVAVTSSTAAKLFNLYPKKGRVAVGSDADLLVWDPEATVTFSSATHVSRCDVSVYEGLTCKGAPRVVVSRGRVVCDDQGLHVTRGAGKFVPTPCNSEFVYSKIWASDKALSSLSPVERGDYKDISTLHGTPPGGDASRLLRGGETVPLSGMGELSVEDRHHNEFHTRPLTSSGGRNMQDSTFSLSGSTYSPHLDDDKNKRGCGYRVNAPPGGRTTQLW